MPYKRHRPVPDREMTRRFYEGENTICQTLRDMYGMTENPDIRLKLRTAMAMAKSMCVKMMEYRDKYGATKPTYQDGI